MTIAQRGTIKADHPVREKFSNRSSGQKWYDYYYTKSHAVCAFGSALAEYEFCFDPDDLINMPGDDGRIMIDIYTRELECAKCVGCAMLTWHRLHFSGQWEFIGYIT